MPTPLTDAEKAQFGFGVKRPQTGSGNNFAGDLVDLTQAGLAGATADMFEGANQLTGFGVTPRDYFRDIQQRNLAQVTPETQQAANDFGLQGQTLETLEFKPTSTIRGGLAATAQGIGSFAPAMVGGGVLSAGLKGLGVAAELAAPLAYGGTNALMTGGGAAEQARQEYLAMTPEQRRRDPRYADIMNKAFPEGVYDEPTNAVAPAPRTRKFQVIDNETGKVEHVLDGDTIKAVFPSGRIPSRLRLAEIDAPETAHPGKPGQPYGEESAAELRGLVGNEVSASITGKDPYGRGIALVEGGDVNHEMAKRGAAWANRRFLTDPSYLDDEAKAREQQLGLWGQPNPQAPWEFRHPNYDRTGDKANIDRLASQAGAEEAAKRAFPEAAGIGFVTGAVAGPAEAKFITEGGGVLKRFAQGAATEALQEFPESAGQQHAVNKALQPIDGRDEMQDVWAQGATGALIGAFTGGGLAGGAALLHKAAATAANQNPNQNQDPNASAGGASGQPLGDSGPDAPNVPGGGAPNDHTPDDVDGSEPPTESPAEVLQRMLRESNQTGKATNLESTKRQPSFTPASFAERSDPISVNDARMANIYSMLGRAKQPGAAGEAGLAALRKAAERQHERLAAVAPDGNGGTRPLLYGTVRDFAQQELDAMRSGIREAEQARGIINSDLTNEIPNDPARIGTPSGATGEGGSPVTGGPQLQEDPQGTPLQPGGTSQESRLDSNVAGTDLNLNPAQVVPPATPLENADGVQTQGQETLPTEERRSLLRNPQGTIVPIGDGGAATGVDQVLTGQTEHVANPEPIQVSEPDVEHIELKPLAGETVLSYANSEAPASTEPANIHAEPRQQAVEHAQALVNRWAAELGVPSIQVSPEPPGKANAKATYRSATRTVHLSDEMTNLASSDKAADHVKFAEVVAHEFGHHLAREYFMKAPMATKMAVMTDFRAWRATLKGMSIADQANSRRPLLHRNAHSSDADMEAAKLTQSWAQDPEEWLADNAARYLMQMESLGRLSPPTEAFVARLARAIEALYTKYTALIGTAAPAKSLEQFLEGMRIKAKFAESAAEEIHIEEPDPVAARLRRSQAEANITATAGNPRTIKLNQANPPPRLDQDGNPVELPVPPTVGDQMYLPDHEPLRLRKLQPTGPQPVTPDSKMGRDLRVDTQFQDTRPDLSRDVNEDGEGDNVGEVRDIAPRNQTMWIHSTGKTVSIREESPTALKGSSSKRKDVDLPGDGAAKRLIAATFGLNHRNLKAVGDGVYTSNDGDFQVLRGTNSDGERVFTAVRQGDEFNSAYKADKVFELVDVGGNRVGLRQTEQSSVEGDVERVSRDKVWEMAEHARQAHTTGKTSDTAYVLVNRDGKEVSYDLPELTKIGRALRDSESAATDSVMLARNDLMRALGYLQAEFGLTLPERTPGQDFIPSDRIIDYDGPSPIYWGEAQNIGRRLKRAEQVLVQEEVAKSNLQRGSYDANVTGSDSIDAGNKAGRLTQDAKQAKHTLKSFGLSLQDEPTRKEQFGTGTSETEMFTYENAEEGQSRDITEGLTRQREGRSGTKEQPTHPKQQVVQLAPGTRRGPKGISDKIVQLMDGIVSDVLGLNTNVYLADEAGIETSIKKLDKVIAATEQLLEAKPTDKHLVARVNQLKEARKLLADAAESDQAHFIALDHVNNAKKGEGRAFDNVDRIHIVFIPSSTADTTARFDELFHEMGHYIQRVALDQVIDEVSTAEMEAKNQGRKADKVSAKRKMLNNIFGLDPNKNWADLTDLEWAQAQERFANQLKLWAVNNEKPRTVVEKFFRGLADKLRALWAKMTNSQYRHFEGFLDALMGLRKSETPTTELGKEYLEALRGTLFASTPIQRKQAVSQAFNPLSFVSRSKKLLDAKDAALKILTDVSALWSPVDAQLRAMGPTGEWIAKQFRVRPGERSLGATFPERMQVHGAEWFNRLPGLLESLPKNKLKAIGEALVMQLSDADIRAKGLDEALEVRRYLDDFYNKLQSLGLKFAKRANYFPLVVDKTKWNAERANVIAILDRELTRQFRASNTPLTASQIYAMAELLHQKISMSDGVLIDLNMAQHTNEMVQQVFGPSFKFQNKRVLTDDMHRALKDYYVQDVASILQSYTHSGLKRAIFQDMFGGTAQYNQFDPGYKIFEKLKLATRGANPEMTPAQAERITHVLIPALMGTLGQRGITPGWRAIQSWLMLGANVALLPLSVLSSFVELGQIDVRAGRYGLKDVITGKNFAALRQIVHTMRTKGEFDRLKKLAYALGTIRDDITEHVLSNAMDPMYQLPTTQRINEKYFNLIQMKRWTDFTRIMGLGVAKTVFDDYASDPAKYAKELRELGVTPKQIQDWLADEKLGLGADPVVHEAVMAALNRWVDGALLRPGAAIRPAWGSDPRFALIWHLKDFMWGFSEVIGRRVFEQARNRKGLVKAVPLAMLGVAMLPLAMLGYELRKAITQDVPSALLHQPIRTQRKEGAEYYMELIDRAGMLGPFQLLLDMENASSHNQFFLLAAAGPTLSKFGDLLKNDMDPMYVIPRSLPFLAQSQVLRDALFGAY